jgi:Arc/MetJ-type ribon-helix-helix transcriptional regulator
MSETADTIELPAELRRQAEELVRVGRFRSVREAAIAAFSLLGESERRRVALGGEIDDALGQHARGELEEIDDDEFSGWIDKQ